MKKKLLSLALALVMCLSLMPCAFAAETKFTDVPADAWYLDELEYAVANGYISGVGDNRFAPDGNITRGQFVTILGRMLDVSTSSGATKFVDVDASSYYAPYVAWAAANGYVNGTSSTTFAPDSNITFEQMGVILANYISKAGVVLSDYTASPAYKDAASISAYAVSSMEQMRQYGLISPDEAGNVNPQKAVSRAYGTVSLVRLAKAMGLGEAPVTAPASGQTSAVADVDKSLYSAEAYAAAVRIHDELWASGKITSSMSQKEKARVYYDWVIQHCEYDYDSADNEQKLLMGAYVGDVNSLFEFINLWTSTTAHDASGVLVNGKAVCEGYTDAYNLLLMLEGIDCEFVTSEVAVHAWTAATLDGVLYHIDTTWGDTTGDANKYFCMTSEAAWARFGGYEKELEYLRELGNQLGG